jgi:hypothetical protein
MRMSIRAFHLLLAACLATGALWAANDAFVGKWKLNPSKSKLIDVMKVEAAGANRYGLSFSPGAVETVVADGTDQPVLYGTTFSIAVEGPRTWKAVRKKQGRTIISQFGISPQTARGSPMTLQVTTPKVRHLRCTMYTSARRGAQVFRVHGRA